MIHLHVWLRPPLGDPVLAGEILVADPDTARGGRLRGEFRYTRAFIESPEAYALDPRQLPLGPHPLAATDPATGLHTVCPMRGGGPCSISATGCPGVGAGHRSCWH